MTLTDTTAREQSETLTFEFELDHALEIVWRALTDPALLSQWLLPVTNLQLAPGATFTLQAPPQPGWDGTVNCRFVEIEPTRKLRYAWRVGDLDTVVTFELAPTANGTRLFLEQTGFTPQQKKNFGGARYGWRLMGGRLQGVLAEAS
jgi:Uncharacterized conserved protein